VLAYVFWHRGTGATDTYEAALAAFHRALAADPPPGFRRSAAFGLGDAPWLPGSGPPYEDWYVVEDWAALGVLNAGAVSGSRAAPHDEVAGRARTGTGGIYAPLGHDGTLDGPVATWVAKPAGVPYAEWHGRLPGPAWQRQMVLGPAPEYAVLADAAVEGLAGATVVRRRAVLS
jgi:hypothetical protein